MIEKFSWLCDRMHRAGLFRGFRRCEHPEYASFFHSTCHRLCAFFLQRRRVSHTEESIPHSGTSTDVPAKVSTQLLFSACVPRPERNRRVRKESWTVARVKSFPACSNRIVFRRQNRPDEGYCQSTALRLFSCSTWNIAGFPRLFGSEVFHVEHLP